MTFPIGPAPLSEREFREVLAKVDASLVSVNASLAKIFENGNQAMVYLPPGLDVGLRAALEKLVEQITEFGERIGKVIANPGDPMKLIDAAKAWTTGIGGPMSAMSGKVTTDQLRIDNFWTGPAAEAYAATLPAQQKAIEAVKAATDSLDTNLQKAAAGIFALWVGIGLAVAAYAAEMVIEATAAATGAGAPPAAAAAAGSTAKVIALVTAVMTAFSAYAVLVADSLSALRQVLYANAPFPGGEWPRSNPADFNDGSLTDGDTTDWRMDVD